jgi:ATP-dependent Clp protease ATP-binding subunit ClpA
MARHHRYSHHVRRAISHAATLAQEYNHPRQDTAHLLVGVMLSEGSIGAEVMTGFDLPVPVARVYLKRLVNPSESDMPDAAAPPRDDSFEKALDQAADEADWLDHHYIGTEHLLLGITRTNLGNAIRLLRLVDITPEQIRRRVRSAISDGQGEFSLEAIRANARLSELSRRVLNAAEQTAVALDHPAVGIGHLLLALIEERRGITSSFLRQSGLQRDMLHDAVQQRDDDRLLISLEPVLHEAVDRAEKLGSHYVGADHLLLVLASRTDGRGLLEEYGATPDKVARLLNKHLQT